MPRLSPFHRLWSTFYYFLGAAPDIPSSSSTLTFHCTHNKSSSMNPEEWRKWQDGANMDSHGIPDATQVWIRATPSATSTPQPRTNSSSPSEGSSDEEAATRGPHVIPEMVGNKRDISLHTVSQSSSQNGPEMKNPRNESYPTVTFIHDVIGNGNSGTLSDGSGYKQVWSSELPTNLPPSTLVAQIPLDPNGRPHNVIGRFWGNMNVAEVKAGVTFSQTFAPLPHCGHRLSEESSLC